MRGNMPSDSTPLVGNSLVTQTTVVSDLIASFLGQRLGKHSLSPALFDLLSTVYTLKDRGSQVEVAERLGISAASTSEAVRLASNKGLLEQVADGTDKRRKRLLLTPKGKQKLQSALEELQAADQALLEGLRAEEVEAAISVLRKAEQNLVRAVRSAPSE
ncbi:MAG: hypothetical protein DCC46_00470 [Armatimonadetes bacterium]|nr:MAG: hypothetical protein DCC46_00470 [Armatimonadota bacterium]